MVIGITSISWHADTHGLLKLSARKSGMGYLPLDGTFPRKGLLKCYDMLSCNGSLGKIGTQPSLGFLTEVGTLSFLGFACPVRYASKSWNT